jgi:hypothetical protein
MTEGDTIHYAAWQVGGVLAGRVPEHTVTSHPHFARERRGSAVVNGGGPSAPARVRHSR